MSETRADPCSYGFRQGRSTQDAIEACFNALSRRNDSAEWILEGDIRACFDTLSHRWLIEHIPTHTGKLRAWLNAGYMEKGAFQLTTEGTPQGGILSPTAANMALDGLERALKARFRRHHKVHLVRYADDFIITGVCAALLADEVQPLVEQFLMERGLTLSREKTQIVHIETGFDFLGFNVRKYHGKLLIKPAPSSIAAVKDKVRRILKTGISQSQGLVIQRLNPVIRGWANYYRHVVSKKAFDDIDSAIWRLTWNWATRRHPRKSPAWVKDRYYVCRDGLAWVFTDGSATLFRMSTLPIQRHVKIRREANPYDPQDADYFVERRRRQRGTIPTAAPIWLIV